MSRAPGRFQSACFYFLHHYSTSVDVLRRCVVGGYHFSLKTWNISVDKMWIVIMGRLAIETSLLYILSRRKFDPLDPLHSPFRLSRRLSDSLYSSILYLYVK